MYTLGRVQIFKSSFQLPVYQTHGDEKEDKVLAPRCVGTLDRAAKEIYSYELELKFIQNIFQFFFKDSLLIELCARLILDLDKWLQKGD